MRPWLLSIECTVMVLLWLTNAIVDMIYTIILFVGHDIGGYVMLGGLGTMHFLLNAWVIRFQAKNINKCGLVLLFLTQTAVFYMLCRRAWRSLIPCCARDDRAKRQKALRAKYSLCCKTWSSTKKFEADVSPLPQGSCIPSELVLNTNSISTVVPVPTQEDSDVMLDQIQMLEEHPSQPIVPIDSTKFIEDTYDIKLDFDEPQEISIGEPNLAKFLLKSLQILYMGQKKLSYHIVLDSKNTILYVTKSDKHIRNLPVRVMNGNPRLICNDIHYALNLTKGIAYEVFAITKRTCVETNFLVEADLSKLIWSIVWPSAVIKLYALLDIKGHTSLTSFSSPIIFIGPAISIITWLITQRGVSEPWKNTAIMIPQRITMTVTRTFLVIGIGITSLKHAAFCYITAKAMGVLCLIAYLAYMKKYKNVELFRDEIDKYTFHPMYHPLIQVCESVVYMAWSVWWYAVTPMSEFSNNLLTPRQFPLAILLATLMGHVLGLTWLWFSRSFVQQPFKDPKRVLRLIQSLEYTNP